jgi:MYXO-CTERM domain-containing protein
MKTHRILLTAVLAALSTTALRAATIDPTDPLAGGIGYKYTVSLGGTDSASFANHVGAWSWEDNALFAPGEDPVGWTHTSNWVALTLTEATRFSLRLERQAGVPWPSAGDPGRVASIDSMFPSFTIWSGWDNDLMDPAVAAALGYAPATANDHHTYNNDGNVIWAEDLSYLDHINNSTETFAEKAWYLPAGQYSIVLGSNAPSTDPNRQGYRATLTTSSVPEPGATAPLLCIGLGALGLLRRRP